jgi:lipopolysaccharide transport system ATP-binding protein
MSRFDSLADSDILWALREIDMQVVEGECVGVIGKNGSGKSTLLKILSRITEPTSGTAFIRGRVASLLEVGTGFHPDLTGRENTYLNGTILGMKRKDIDRKFSEIVAFAGIERFIDTPVKRYSSGMRVRLGFAVAAHLDPEILIIDEVLAVGDLGFQEKCVGKIGEVTSRGRTVIFVSHNMDAVANLCTKAYWIESGSICASGKTESVIEEYLQFCRGGSGGGASDGEVHLDSNHIVRTIRIVHNGQATQVVPVMGSFGIEVICKADPKDRPSIVLGFAVRSMGNMVFATTMRQTSGRARNSTGICTIKAFVEKLPLAPGHYFLSLYLGDESGHSDFEILEDVMQFDVVWKPQDSIMQPPETKWGRLFVPVIWKWQVGK